MVVECICAQLSSPLGQVPLRRGVIYSFRFAAGALPPRQDLLRACYRRIELFGWLSARLGMPS